MGEKNLYQPLTKEDKITVVLYRTGIVMSSLIISVIAFIASSPSYYRNNTSIGLKFSILIILLYASVGMSVFFIHLYISKFHRFLKKLYYVSLLALALLFFDGRGDILGVLVDKPYGLLLLIPLTGCLGFITAKEAFCFKLIEGYLIALTMPLYLAMLAAGGMTMRGASYGLLFIAAMLILFTFRKVFMPIHFDIGDKSAYS
ncbi:MAG: DUF2301 domain-containing membrane protein [Nitrospirae bacterium]|nr:DUF2301 domain-containing membrane protein [Nitrospirota bacterium]MCL5238565.1 DUF2301 domain-containing membrane protein [Nitrospirota bacterium]